MGRIAATHLFNGFTAGEHHLNGDEKNNDAAKKQKRGEFDLQNIGKNGFATQREGNKDDGANDGGTKQHFEKGGAIQLLDQVKKVDAHKKRVEKHQKQRHRLDERVHHIEVAMGLGLQCQIAAARLVKERVPMIQAGVFIGAGDSWVNKSKQTMTGTDIASHIVIQF